MRANYLARAVNGGRMFLIRFMLPPPLLLSASKAEMVQDRDISFERNGTKVPVERRHAKTRRVAQSNTAAR